MLPKSLQSLFIKKAQIKFYFIGNCNRYLLFSFFFNLAILDGVPLCEPEFKYCQLSVCFITEYFTCRKQVGLGIGGCYSSFPGPSQSFPDNCLHERDQYPSASPVFKVSICVYYTEHFNSDLFYQDGNIEADKHHKT